MSEPKPGAFALTYASLGWHVIPCWWIEDGRCACDDPACNRNNWGKHPLQRLVPSGIKNATTRSDLITLWWETYPRANVAVVCEPSGLVVIDIDPRNGGDASWDRLVEDVEVPPTLTASTGGGGKHHVYRDAELRKLGRARGKLAAGVDVKWSGYVLVAPSNHASGGTYSWDEWKSPVDLSIPLATALTVPESRAVATSEDGKAWSGAVDFEQIFTGVQEGGRHQAFVSYAASLRARRVKLEEAKLLVSAAWSQVDEGEHPFPIAEALRIVTDTYATRPEGFSGEVQLEQYAGWLETHAKRAAEPPARAGEDNIGGGPQSSAIDPTTNGNGHASLWTPRDEERAGQFAHHLFGLPEELAPIKQMLLQEQMRREARALITRIEQLTHFDPPLVEGLDHLLAQDFAEPRWIVNGLHEYGTNSSLTATYKSGKTTVQLNLIKSLVDGEPFLGEFEIPELCGNVAFFNYELTRETFARWAGRMGIVHPERVKVLNLRGHKLELGLERTQEWIAEQLRRYEIEFWIADPLARAFYGDENSNTELKQWTDAVDEIKHHAGCPNFQVTLHTGRGEQVEGEERARGATRIDDWADTRWVLTRVPDGTRFFYARGREVDQPDRPLTFNEETWKVSVNGIAPMSRTAHRDFTGQQKVADALHNMGATSREAGVNKSTLRGAITGNNTVKSGWITDAVTAGLIQHDGSVFWIGEPTHLKVQSVQPVQTGVQDAL